MSKKAKSALCYLVKRASEKTTWIGVAGIAALFGANLNLDVVDPIINMAGTVSGLAAILYPEQH